jgi:thiamine pyrophosphate-dependent acetolactate synthase large subunit-like protein
MSKRVADLIVETLQAAGVKTCYGVVGAALNRIASAIGRALHRAGQRQSAGSEPWLR